MGGTESWNVFVDFGDGTTLSQTGVTDTSFDYALAPFAGGLFIGDYVGLDTAGNDFLAFFTQAVSEEDPSSAFFRRVKGKRFSHRKISKRRDRDDD